VFIAESPDGNYSRRKTPGLCLVEALPAEVVALGISICDTTRDGSRMVGNRETDDPPQPDSAPRVLKVICRSDQIAINEVSERTRAIPTLLAAHDFFRRPP
jgi:hypothetical protein